MDRRWLWSTRFVVEKLRHGALSESAVFGYFLTVMTFRLSNVEAASLRMRGGYRRRSGGQLPRLACHTARTSTTSSRGT
ncbi:MAG: hypothetical protein ABL961_14685 [Vicinamibacterales bacterium]